MAREGSSDVYLQELASESVDDRDRGWVRDSHMVWPDSHNRPVLLVQFAVLCGSAASLDHGQPVQARYFGPEWPRHVAKIMPKQSLEPYTEP